MSAEESVSEGRSKPERLAMGAAALNLWVVVVLLPLLLGGSTAGPDFFSIAAACVALLLALPPLVSVGPMTAFALCVYPMGVAAAAALRGGPPLEGIGLVTAVVSLMAYAATAASVVTRPHWRNVATKHVSSGVREAHRRRSRMRRAVLAIVIAAACVIGVWIPAFYFEAPAWTDENRAAGRTFAALVAAVVAVLIVAGMAGPATRKARKSPKAKHSKRATTLMLIALFGFLVLLIVRGVIGG